MAAHTLDQGMPEAEQSALFAYLVMQQSNMALMLLGKLPSPDGAEVPTVDPDAARYFIDQLGMLEIKTKGNLTRQESDLLKQTLMVLRMAYVEVTQQESSAIPNSATHKTTPPTTPENQAAPGASPDAASEENRKKFSKKY